MKFTGDLINFFENQGCVIVSTFDKNGFMHSSCKGMIKIDSKGWVYLLDLYQARTYRNLEKDPRISVTAVNEHDFTGYCLKGRAKIVKKEKLGEDIIRAWEEKLTSRITKRLLKNIREGKGHPAHPESLLPNPQYLIVMKVKEAVDLTPPVLKE